MRISRIRIGSYGRIRDRTMDVAPGLTVVHGPNESGKTTVMEFIRNTLVPTNKRDVYPERAKTDSGSILYEEDGREGEVTLTQKARGGDVPDSIARLEPGLFRSVFAMGQRDPDDDKVVTSGDIVTRFLSVPGGAGMPSAIDSITKRVDTEVGRTTRSQSRLRELDSKADQLDSQISELRSSAESYGELARRLEGLDRELEEAERDAEASRRESEVFTLYESQRGNYERLSAARRELNSLGEFRRVSKTDSDRAVALEADVRSAECNLESDRKEVSRLREPLGGVNPDTVSGLRGRIREAADGRDRYRSESYKPKAAPAPARKGPNPAVVLGVVLVVLGIVASTFSVYSLVLSAVGLAVVAVGSRRGRTPVPSVPLRDEAFISAYEGNVRELSSRLGIRADSIEHAVDSMLSLANAHDRLREHEGVSVRINEIYLSKKGELDSFYAGYSGREGFAECVRRTGKEAELRTTINNMRDAIRNSGLDPEQPKCPVESRPSEDPDISRLSVDKGRVEAEMRHVLDTERLDSLIDTRESLEAERGRVLMAGAVAVLASAIASEACDDAYSTVQPGVAATADRYLSMMTSGRYRIDLDPRRKDTLAVVDSEGEKGPKRWSTGLRAQVLLSLKLAVARELGDGRVPIILDDVLLPFDPVRKEGALRALEGISEEMQVLMFTCDPSVAEMVSGRLGVRVVEMEAFSA